MNQVLMVNVTGETMQSALFVNAKLIASSHEEHCKVDTTIELESLATSICSALSVSLVEVTFSKNFRQYSWSEIRDLLLTRRVMSYRKLH